ncbi:MAG: DNA mismatch repair protein MutS [Veillonella sp.]|uniref:DNA mismatch repair protein MutS n=1 Tax=Veillonella sp. TaxID=1926307 RepID=UPI00290C49C0|nr:DNA mismatch repair protein MutS [Veillonella sp.]MDU6570766.1 DNA mismatch repair protein MutS [Veillonella sp.]
MAKKVTPMMEQYLDIKSRHSDELLFFRLGDFYELFNEDALIASRELNITLTGRPTGNEERTPMCGVPFHAAESYIETLVKKGYKVAICEQLEDPKAVKGIVKRDVIQVITPGTVMTENGNDARSNNFLALFYLVKEAWILVFSDVSTGEVIWDRVPQNNISQIYDSLSMYRPAEIIVPEGTILPQSIVDFIHNQFNNVVLSPFTSFESVDSACKLANNHFQDMGLMEEDVLAALGFMLLYLQDVIKTEIAHINYVHQMDVGNRLILDTSSLRHLEITHNLRDGGVKGTLLDVLDRTLTPMGARLLKQWLESPLTDISTIQRRQAAVAELISRNGERCEIQSYLDSIYDFERIVGRIETGSVSPRDFTSLRESLQVLPQIKNLLKEFSGLSLSSINTRIDNHADIYDLLNRAIAEQPALTLKDGRVIRDGYNEELDELRSLATNSEVWLQKLEDKAREETGLKLKTKYNKVFGYFFEVSKAQVDKVPAYFIRKQTTVNAERYITPDLKEFEIKILSAKEKIISLEQQLYQDLRNQIKGVIKKVQETARALAELDVLASLATVAYESNYICPNIVMNGQINIRDGRHPVIEKFLKREVFVPNDVVLNHDDEEFMLITGPNMAGKSTYMRQVAILMIMAQIGSFIPAREATISPVDRVFTRVGASDDISTGQSTFMVEMKEVAYILENATSKSLIILDEIGRGTSTFDGLSIAQAVVEHICKHIHAKTLFATHYHELISLEDVYPRLKNYTVAVKEKGKDIAFLRRIIRGGADRSYGIHVAKLAGLPAQVLKRAEVILESLEEQNTDTDDLNNRVITSDSVVKYTKSSIEQDDFGNLFTHSVVDSLLAIDVNTMTPIEALNAIHQLQAEARNGGGK